MEKINKKHSIIFLGITLIFGVYIYNYLSIKCIKKSNKTFIVKLQEKGRYLISNNKLNIKFHHSIFGQKHRSLFNESGKIILSKNNKNIASFSKIYKKQQIKENEIIVNYKIKYKHGFHKDLSAGHISLGADFINFLPKDILEMNQAQYIKYKANSKGKTIIIDILDKNLTPLNINIF